MQCCYNLTVLCSVAITSLCYASVAITSLCYAVLL